MNEKSWWINAIDLNGVLHEIVRCAAEKVKDENLNDIVGISYNLSEAWP